MKKSSRTQSSLKNYESSVVQIINTGISYDYKNPYKAPESEHCSGSGFIIQDTHGKNYILTNAHVVENSTFTEVQLSNEDNRYEAAVKNFGHDCDLALLDVKDKEFWKKTKPLSLGNMVHHKQSIKVVGFPRGGEEISITQGIVSRIEVEQYEHSGKHLLQVQVDAAINDGNSGGPVFCRNKVVGVAFQGDPSGESLGYIIPTPVIQHFLTESFQDKPYEGFPTPDFLTQKTSNSALRQELKMRPEQSGLLVTHVPYLSSAYQILKPKDVILSINKHKLTNMGFINLSFDNHIHFSYLFHQNYFGDIMKMKVLREGKELNINIKLKYNAVGNQIILPFERDKAPCFFIHSGIIFQPVTKNYIFDGDNYTPAGNELISSGHIKEKAERKNSEQQYVIINSILACNKTSGYQHISDTLVTHVNDIEINNIYDLIKVIAQTKSSRLVLSTKDNELIVFERMSEQEQNLLLKTKYGIDNSHSQDLDAYIKQCKILFEESEIQDRLSSPLDRNTSIMEQEDDDSNSDSADEEVEIDPKLLTALKAKRANTTLVLYPNLGQRKRKRELEANNLLLSSSLSKLKQMKHR